MAAIITTTDPITADSIIAAAAAIARALVDLYVSSPELVPTVVPVDGGLAGFVTGDAIRIAFQVAAPPASSDIFSVVLGAARDRLAAHHAGLVR
jgi:hypothetical protein